MRSDIPLKESMDAKKSIEISILVLICTGASEMLLFGWIVVHQYGLTTLYMSRAGRTILSMFLIFTGAIFYYIYLKIQGEEIITPDNDRLGDPRECALDIDLPYHRAFDLCRRAVESLPRGEIQSADADKGIVKGWAFGPDPSGVGIPNITFTIQKVEAGKTHVTIRCITLNPSHQVVPRLIEHYFCRNERCVKRVYDYIREPTNQGDGIILGEGEGNPPDILK